MIHRLRERLTFANFASAAALIVALGGSAYAATSAGSDGRIRGCVSQNGQLVVLRSGQQSHKGQRKIVWNKRGPRGLPGPPGRDGTNGKNGTDAATNVVVRSKKSSTGFVTIQCHAGEKVTGGGGYANTGFQGTQPEYNIEGGPPTGWKSYSSGTQTYAYVICASP